MIMSKYDFEFVMDENNSLSKIVNRINSGSRVLEFGPAEGRMTKYLFEEKNCQVTIVELDRGAYESARKYAIDGICADIESEIWIDYLSGKKFDYIVLADVLEHLKYPNQTIKCLKNFLQDDASILISIPNIAHNKILIKLYNNHFDYTDIGLLDNTHLRFWGYENLEVFFRELGYQIVYEDMTYDNNWGGDQSVEEEKINDKLFSSLQERVFGNAYQYILEVKEAGYCKENNIKKESGNQLNEARMKTCTVFYDFGEGFDTQYSSSIAPQYIKENNMYIASIPIICGTKKLRFDPVEGVYILCRIKTVTDEAGNNCDIQPLNGCVYEGMDIFDTKDPQYIIKTDFDKHSTITVAYMFSPVTGENISQIQDLIRINSKIHEIEDNNKELQEQCDRMKFSNSSLKDKLLLTEKSTSLRNEIILDLCKEGNSELSYVTERVVIQEPQNQIMSDALELYKHKYDNITNSFFWRVTKPARVCVDAVKRLCLYEKKRTKDSSIDVLDAKPWIGVHLHLYYEDLLEEFCAYFDNIPQAFDLYISCKQGANQSEIEHVARKIKNVREIVIKESLNKGRDIAPFYVLFRDELSQYECLLHVHSKKSLYTGEEKVEWRHWALDGVLKNEDSVAQILHMLLVAEPKAGMVYGEMTPTLPLLAFHWLRNVPKGRELFRRLNMKFEDGMFMYPVGSFFWVRTEAIQPLFDLKLTYADFDEEKGQIDGTYAHALERTISWVVKKKGFNSFIFDPQKNKLCANVSYGSFDQYFGYNVENISQLLNSFEIVTFDIFDTLITRMVYQPQDVFALMQKIIQKKYKITIDFIGIRNQMEKIAWEKHGDYCNIHNIYDELKLLNIFSEGQTEELKALEIELEYKLCIPRTDALEIFNNLVSCGKRVILISDMYLTKSIIESMLLKCGYKGYEDIWISCEKGLRKDRETLWEAFFKQFGEYRTIHVGDNPHSDCQVVGDRQRINMLWLSPNDQFKFSSQYDKFEKYINTTVENSLMLGIFVHKYLYNSPFALKANGSVQLKDLEEIAQGIFAPVFLVFLQFLEKASADKLLFLSREGCFLQKLYKEYCASFKCIEISNLYFYTSRRAASLPQIKSLLDIKEILQTSYNGCLSVLLKERFGIENPIIIQDMQIHLPDDLNKVLAVLALNAEELLSEIDEERNSYTEYIDSVVEKDEKLAVVDVGYAGTIQYYLMKLLERDIEGYYMALEYNIKPQKLGGTCNSVYNFGTDKVFEFTQLFLEAVTAASHGQVIKMNEKDTSTPVLKLEKETCWKEAQQMQEAIINYINEISIYSDFVELKYDKLLAADILGEVLRPNFLGTDLKDVFTVHDEYCSSGGEWRFDCCNYRWVNE